MLKRDRRAIKRNSRVRQREKGRQLKTTAGTRKGKKLQTTTGIRSDPAKAAAKPA